VKFELGTRLADGTRLTNGCVEGSKLTEGMKLTDGCVEGFRLVGSHDAGSLDCFIVVGLKEDEKASSAFST